MIYGNKPTDSGNLLVDESDYGDVSADPIAARYLRRFVGARELLHDLPRWCLWLVHAPASDIARSPVLRQRVQSVKEMREDSSKAATRAKAATPHLFDERRHPASSYLAIPAHVGENRRFLTAARFGTDVICGNANFLAPDPDGFILGVLSSSMFIAWMRAIGGRIKSDLRFSNTYTYNNFPLPDLKPRQRASIVAAASQVIDARAEHPNLSLAELYEPLSMPPGLVAAHAEVDRAVGALYGRGALETEAARQRVLLRTYGTLTGQEALHH
ncbi:type IIL restriction-modification enzyme MmeI [Actinopolymorpha sp. B9G3]|uniref:type IIL restriction-modification enzyme MmeI n=1 Tax=Actinopolymorpha sp. B9G3 TaxID=3158970 RepID=UPI0032D8E303